MSLLDSKILSVVEELGSQQMVMIGNKGDGEEMVMSMRGLSKCPVFSGKEEDYEEWRQTRDNTLAWNCEWRYRIKHCAW